MAPVCQAAEAAIWAQFSRQRLHKRRGNRFLNQSGLSTNDLLALVKPGLPGLL
jgi:hypothetical protein